MLHEPTERLRSGRRPVCEIMGVSVERIEETGGRERHATERCQVLERQGEVTESREGCRLSGIEDCVVVIGRETTSSICEGVQRSNSEICWGRTPGACGRRCAAGSARACRT